MGMQDGSVCVMTRVGTYLKVFNALHNFRLAFGIVAKRAEDIGAGVAKMTCLKVPNDEVEECKVYPVDILDIRVIAVETCM